MVNEKGKTAAATANNDDDAEAAIKNNTLPKKKFPTPQYLDLVTIYTKNVVTVNRDDADAPLEKRWNENLVIPCTEEIKKKKKIRVKMQSLLVKMINRLIREEVVPIEAGRECCFITELYKCTNIGCTVGCSHHYATV